MLSLIIFQYKEYYIVHRENDRISVNIHSFDIDWIFE